MNLINRFNSSSGLQARGTIASDACAASTSAVNQTEAPPKTNQALPTAGPSTALAPPPTAAKFGFGGEDSSEEEGGSRGEEDAIAGTPPPSKRVRSGGLHIVVVVSDVI